MDTSKIIRGVVSSGRYTVTAPIIKEDYGLYLKIEGVELPQTYEVDFSNSESSGTSVTMIGNADGVLIPRQFISSGKDVFAFLYHVGEDFGRTVYKFRIPNKLRPDRTDEQPTPEEQSAIDQAISALNTAVEQTAQDKADADVSAQNASADAERAEEARTDAQNYATQAEQSAADAQESASQASASATASANSASEAQTASTNAETYALNSGNKAVESAQSAQASANSATSAQGYAQSASASARSASGYASQAQSSAQAASAKAQDASGYAQTASQKAVESAQSAANAQTYANTAEQAKTASQTAQTAAETAQGKAEDAQAAAESVAESIPSDYSQLSEDVSDLKEGLNDISKVIGVNAVGETEYAFGTGNGYIDYSDGTITETSNVHNTGFISLNGVKSLTAYTKISAVGAAIAFYDKDKAYLQNVSIAGDNTQKTYRIDLTDSAYANVAYAIVSFFGTKSDNFPKALTDGGIASRADVNDAIEKAEEVVTPIRTSLFDWLNYGTPENCRFYDDRIVDANGNINASTNASSLVFKVEPNTTYMVYIPNKTRAVFVESAENDFYVGTTATVLSASAYSVYNGVIVNKITTGATTKYVMTYFYNGSYDYESNKNNIIITKDDFLPYYTPLVKKELLPSIQPIDPSDTSFFANANYFDRKKAKYFNDRFVNGSGVVAKSATTSSLVIPVKPSTTYWFYAPNMNRNYVAESTSELFKIGSTYTLIKSSTNSTPFAFTTGATAKYVMIYFVSGAYDYEANADGIVLNKDVYSGLDAVPYIPYKYLPSDLSSPLKDANVLIFGDSITDCCSLTIDGNNETTAYSWRIPSNSYVDGNGNTVQFSMWAKILKESEPCGEVRNYALSGASYKTATRESGNERQNVQYQIDVALNDRDNPHNVFSVDDFAPNVVIFALGTNDGAPADTYESAMNATVYTGTDIDVDATISALDDTKTIASARKAFMRIKKAFPMAQIYCVLPIQRASNDTNVGALHDNLKQMAQRYGCIIVDGAFSTGITRDFNSNNALGVYLKDGLHPNEKGQNLLARSIITALKSHYIPFGTGYNQ